MSIDFEIPAEAKAIRDKVRHWVEEECKPAEKLVKDKAGYQETLAKLRKKARAQGLWMPFVPTEYGGMGLGPLANALVQMELGESYLGALSMNSQAPDDATILTLIAHGTDYQKDGGVEPAFGALLSARSIGTVTCCSTSSAACPGYNEMMTVCVSEISG